MDRHTILTYLMSDDDVAQLNIDVAIATLTTLAYPSGPVVSEIER